MPESLKLFCSYSRKDSQLCEALVAHLRGMEHDGIISLWFDRNVPPGDDWNEEITENLDKADVILLLISDNFFASRFCSLEMARALKRKDSHGVILAPVMLGKYNLPKSLSKFQGILAEKPVSAWSDRNDALYEATREIKQLIAHHWPDLVPAEKLAHPQRQNLKKLFYYLCDRGPQRDELHKALDPAKIDRRHPFVILMQGGTDDAHSWYLDRLEKELLPQLLGEKPDRLSPMIWPEYESKRTPGELFASKFAECLTTLKAYATIAEMNEALRVCGRVNLLPSSCEAETWGKHGHKLLNAYLQFWKEWPTLPEGRTLIPTLSILFGKDDEANGRIRRCLKNIAFAEGGVVLPPFPEIRRVDVQNWIEHERVRSHFDSPPEAVVKLDMIFRDETPTLPMVPLAEIHLPRFLNNL